MSAAQLKDLTRLQQPARAPGGQVQISYGVHHLEVAIAGKSVGEVRQALKEPLNIDPRALALVNGRDVAASYVLKQGDQLEFVRLAGEKGAIVSWERPLALLLISSHCYKIIKESTKAMDMERIGKLTFGGRLMKLIS